MTCKTLINIIGKYNHYNILAALNLKPETVVLVRLKEDIESAENAKTCITSRLLGVHMIEYVMKEQSYEELSEIIKAYDSMDTILNLSGGSKLFSLLALQAVQNTQITPVYIDNDKGRILKIKETMEELVPIEIELEVEDIVCSTGAEIIKHSSDIYDKPENHEIMDFIIHNYDMWGPVKDILRNTRLVRQFEFKPLLIEIATSKLSYMQLKALEKFLQMLEHRRLITGYKLYYDYIEFTFTTREAKAFVMTAGSWLEALTYFCIKEMKEVKDVISGMLFVWDSEIKVHNELDVVAAVDSHLVCVSCKDTEKYDVEELNELEVYAEHLGGRKVTKLLVSTEAPERGEMTMQRADEMGIYIIIFDGDLDKFKERLRMLLT